MDQLKSVFIPLLLLLAISNGSNAQPLQQAKTELSQYQASRQKIDLDVQTIDLRIKSYETKIADAKQDIDTAKQDLEIARSALIQAKHDKSPEAARKIELAQKSFDITQLGYDNRLKRLDRLERKLGQLLQDKDGLLTRSRTKKSQIKTQTRKVSSLSRQNQVAATPTPAPRKAKVAAAPKVKPSPAPPPIKLVEDINASNSSPIQTAKLRQPVNNNATARSAAKKSKIKSDGTKPERKYAQEQMAILRNLTKGASAQEHREWQKFKGLELRVGKRSSEEFEYLGNRQYYIETQLNAGSSKMKIGSKTYSAYIRSPGTYIVIYDTSDKRDPYFALFKKSWTQ